jgi:hypothetical protein
MFKTIMTCILLLAALAGLASADIDKFSVIGTQPKTAGTAFDGGWVTGVGKGWKLTSSPGPYDNCGAYDLCNLQYAVDGTAENPAGKSFDFNAPDGPPYQLTIDMNSSATFSGWRFFTGGYPCYGSEHVSLQYKTEAGNFTDVPGAALHFTATMNFTEIKYLSAPFTAPVTAQVWRVNAADKLRHDEHSCYFQTYFQEVQFKSPSPTGGTCDLKKGTNPGYKALCNQQKTEADCTKLSETCTWTPTVASTCHLKNGAPAPYGPTCAKAVTEADCDNLSLTCTWGPPSHKKQLKGVEL